MWKLLRQAEHVEVRISNCESAVSSLSLPGVKICEVRGDRASGTKCLAARCGQGPLSTGQKTLGSYSLSHNFSLSQME